MSHIYLRKTFAVISLSAFLLLSDMCNSSVVSLHAATVEATETTEGIDATEEIDVTEGVDATEVLGDTETIDCTEKTDATEGTESIEGTEPVDETEFIEETESIDETELIEETESVDETELIEETESIDETEFIEGTESIDETESTEDISVFQKLLTASADSYFANVEDGSIVDGYYIVKVYASEITSASKTYTVVQRALNEAAANATSSNPYKVVVEPGNYTLTKSLHIYSNTYLYMEDVTFTQSASVKSNMLKIGTTSDTQTGYYYKNITIDGGTSGGTFNENGNSNTAIKVAHTKNFCISGITLRNTVDAHLMEIAGVNGFTVNNCIFKEQTMVSRQYLEAIQIDYLIPSHFSGYAYEVLANKNISVKNCTFSDVPRGVGSHTSIQNLPLNKLTIKNNTFYNLESAAIQLQNCINCTISNNTINKCPRAITIYSMRNYGEGNYLASTVTNAGGIASTVSCDYIRPSGDQNIIIKNNSITCSGDDVYNPEYERAAILIAGTDCPTDSTPVSGDILPSGNYYVSGVSICKNTISTSQYGIILQDTKKSTIISNTVSFTTTNAQIGIQLRNSSTDNTIQKNTIKNCNGTSIFIYAGSSCKSLSNNVIKKSNFCDIWVKASTVKSIKSNTLTSSGVHGIFLDSATVTTLANNKLQSVGSYSIAVSSGKVTKIYQNIIRSSGSHSIVIYNDAAVSSISENKLSSGGGYGINIGSINSNLKISSNTIKKSGDAQLYINTDNTSKKITITNNTFSGTSNECGIFVNSGRVSLSKNTLSHFWVPIQILESAKCTVYTNTLKKNSTNKVQLADSTSTTLYKRYKQPSKPASVTAKSVSSSKIKLSWKMPSNADGCYIYRSTSKKGTYQKIATVTKSKGTTYTDKKLSKNRTYYYKLVAYKKSTNKNTIFLSSFSKTVSKKTRKQ